MEIPQKLKGLYKHWEKHTLAVIPSQKTNLHLPDDLEWFMAERMRIWEKKTAGEKPPFTTNETLQKYRFCNIYRELDRQTIEIHSQLRPLIADFSLWLLNLCFERFVCRPSTIETVGFLSFDSKHNAQVYKKLNQVARPRYGNAYVFPVSTIQRSKFPTREEFFCFYLPQIIPEIARIINSFNNLSVNQALQRILPAFGYNLQFHWTEILIDVAYQFPEKINLFSDFHVGPGAKPTAGLIDPNLEPAKVVDRCVGIKPAGFPYLEYNYKPVFLSAENWEGIFCEYRKHSHLKVGHGRVRKYIAL